MPTDIPNPHSHMKLPKWKIRAAQLKPLSVTDRQLLPRSEGTYLYFLCGPAQGRDFASFQSHDAVLEFRAQNFRASNRMFLGSFGLQRSGDRV